MTGDFWSPVRLSIQVAGLAGILVFILGIFLARMMAKKQFRGRVLLETAFLLPLVLPPSVVGFLLIVIFGKNGLPGQFIERVFDQPLMFTWWAAVIASTVVAFPLMYQSAKTGFEGIDEEIENAARVDGAGEWRLFLFVTLPLAVKSIVTGAILSSARALGEFGATLMFAGNIPGQTQTIPTAIYIAMDSGNMTLAWLWVAVIIVISFIMLFIVTYIK
ncbi:molybdate ABC transporter permease subunit [Peribacillus castrilensis]|jgi:molybdate transport system permease protein|uniref:Molybdenum transport system permease n=3 Tax=Peribacillus TaxID=2675229 RepID=A0AAJ1VAA4_9BACI|nr:MULTISPECIES: molybdate ABC transporter permease subunit [Bacillaceae]MBL3642875.1 molybdate ABC transporter permease subunit [Bacillus sp. RHFB]MCP1095767.1 molybdate ABC transporter permease subunit [Bacillaceae bacterium OS4b]MEC0273638.1 molybdate ABC transporter permease subunit [Peribacillus castrilensis]PHD73027.1 molybdate ABC transporter permease subunit [Bacillus sp. AFS043905]QNK50559.1 molybdate ABC transporter permease subunit [Brevibacterium sp. PAMC23299]